MSIHRTHSSTPPSTLEAYLAAVGRPARREIAAVTGGQGSAVGALEIDDPQVRAAGVGDDVVEVADVDDLAAVRINSRIRHPLELEDIHQLEDIGVVVGEGGATFRDSRATRDNRAAPRDHRAIRGRDRAHSRPNRAALRDRRASPRRQRQNKNCKKRKQYPRRASHRCLPGADRVAEERWLVWHVFRLLRCAR